jgi:nuclear transport factor 2 (NTF2) superfamily protein
LVGESPSSIFERNASGGLAEFDDNDLMRWRDAPINDYEIDESERKFRWER